MKLTKITALSLSTILLVLSLYLGITINNAQENLNEGQGKKNENISKILIKDKDEFLTPSQWLEKSLKDISAIKPGMKRADLYNLFSQDGGISSPQHSRYLYRNFPIKIEVEFRRAAARENRDKDGRLLGDEYDDDVITKVSKPYLEYPVND